RRRGWLEDAALLVKATDQAIGDFGDLFAAEDADDVIDIGAFLKQDFTFALGQAAGYDYAPGIAATLQGEHFLNGGIRLLAGAFDEAARIDDDEIGSLRFVH